MFIPIENVFISIGILLATMGAAALWNYFVSRQERKALFRKEQSSILLGNRKDSKEKIYLREELRTAHTQVIGTTNAGKTASVILPWAVQDIEQGRGLIIIDGKADKSFLETLHSHALANNREDDFMVFSLANPAISKTFNPFSKGSAEQITERAFSAFNITDPYYASIQISALRTIIALLLNRGEVPMPGVIREFLRDPKLIADWAEGVEDSNLLRAVESLISKKQDEFELRTSGLAAALDHFSQGLPVKLFNAKHSEIDLLDAILQKKICYFQLPTMQYQFLGAATGKLVLQCLQSAISDLQVRGKTPSTLFSVYLDDFNDYMYPAFASLLNKSRSANVGVVFSHQSLGDLDKVAPDFKQIVLTNTNLKVIMRSNDPATAEHFSSSIGTVATEKVTRKREKIWWFSRETGDQSVRETEEFIFHPNTFKSKLGRGEGVVVVPHPGGTEVMQIQFSMAKPVPQIPLPSRSLPSIDFRKAASIENISPSIQVNEIIGPQKK